MPGKLRIASYLLWIAFVLICINFLWGYLGETLSIQVHTFGLILQLAGIITVVFVLLSNVRLALSADSLEDIIEQCIDTILLQPLASQDEQVKSTSIIVFIKLLIFSLCNLGIYFSSKYLGIESGVLFVLLFGMVLLYIYVWAWSFLLVIVFRLMGRREPVSLGRVFELSDYGLSMVAMTVFLLVFVPIRDFITWLSKTSRVERVGILSLPLIFLGTVFQLISAFID